MLSRLRLIACLLATSASIPALATTYIVIPDGTGDFPTIQEAIDAAVDGDVIELADGVFTGAGNREIDFGGRAITVRSQSGDPEACVIDCRLQGRGFIFRSGEGSDSIVMGITISWGHPESISEWPEDSGGAVLCLNGTSPTLRNCSFTEGGASNEGGAVFCTGASPQLYDCRFEDNGARLGGGMSCHNSSPTLERCVFLLCGANLHGGAVAVHSSSTVAMTDCTFSDNIATSTEIRGGALYCDDSWLFLYNCTLYSNSDGQILLSDGSTALIRNSIISFGEEESIHCEMGSAANLGCCDIYGNGGGDWVGCVADQHGASGNISEDPLFCNAEDGDLTLREDSPCASLSPPNWECELIGAWPVGCTDPTPVEPATWGRIKTRFHR